MTRMQLDLSASGKKQVNVTDAMRSAGKQSSHNAHWRDWNKTFQSVHMLPEIDSIMLPHSTIKQGKAKAHATNPRMLAWSKQSGALVVTSRLQGSPFFARFGNGARQRAAKLSGVGLQAMLQHSVTVGDLVTKVCEVIEKRSAGDRSFEWRTPAQPDPSQAVQAAQPSSAPAAQPAAQGLEALIDSVLPLLHAAGSAEGEGAHDVVSKRLLLEAHARLQFHVKRRDAATQVSAAGRAVRNAGSSESPSFQRKVAELLEPGCPIEVLHIGTHFGKDLAASQLSTILCALEGNTSVRILFANECGMVSKLLPALERVLSKQRIIGLNLGEMADHMHTDVVDEFLRNLWLHSMVSFIYVGDTEVSKTQKDAFIEVARHNRKLLEQCVKMYWSPTMKYLDRILPLEDAEMLRRWLEPEYDERGYNVGAYPRPRPEAVEAGGVPAVQADEGKKKAVGGRKRAFSQTVPEFASQSESGSAVKWRVV